MPHSALQHGLVSVVKLLMHNINGPAAYRLGRALYKHARGDHANDMENNGEIFVQRSIVTAWMHGNIAGETLVVFDVGANVGNWSSAMLNEVQRCGDKTKTMCLYAFEPVPATFNVLKRRLGSAQGVHLVSAALSSASGRSQIYISGTNAGSNSLHSDVMRGQEDLVEIAMMTASEFSSRHDLDHVHFLKCDTEGHDMEVIRGAMPLLRSGALSVLQFEYNHRWVYARNFLRDVFVATEGLPYRVAKIQRDVLLVLDEWHPELEKFFEGNYLLIHQDALGWFQVKRISWDKFNAMRANDA